MNEEKTVEFFIHKTCGHCAEFKELKKEEIAAGKITLLDISTDKAALKRAQELGITMVPTPVVKDMKTGLEQVCQITKDGKKITCPDGSEVDF